MATPSPLPRAYLPAATPARCRSTNCPGTATHQDGRCDECHEMHREDMRADGQQADAERPRIASGRRREASFPEE